MKEKKYTAISLFSGAMGLDLGIESAGFKIKACIENDTAACETIKRNRPDIKLIAKDIRCVEPFELLSEAGLKTGEVDLVVGGPPCQPFSTAATIHRRAMDDKRGSLLDEYFRIIEHVRPHFFLMENVRNILVSSAKLDDGDEYPSVLP